MTEPAGIEPPLPQLPPYSGPHPKCVKCGTRDAETRHLWPGHDEVLKQNPDGSYMTRTATIEQMRRTCENCGYTWYEQPLDATNTQ